MIFDVAVWRVWSLSREGFISLPEVALVEAASAFEAVAWVMCANGIRGAGHAAAASLDGSIVYRAYGVRLGVGGRAVGDQASLGSLRHGVGSPAAGDKRCPRLDP